MLALIAAFLFVLVAFDVHLGTVNLFYLGLAFLAAHFAYAIPLPWRRP